jgi:hypothetical protein
LSRQIVKCQNCGIEGQVGETCFKCDTKLHRSFTRPLYVIDVAHGGEDREDAIRKVIKGIEISLNNNHKGLKVIHGHGSKSGSGIIKDHVIRQLRREAKRLNARLVKDKGNPGAHILYFD